jgi:hypothetical protein
VANIRALATIAILVTAGSGASIAMPPQDIPGEVKSCQAITDDKARLRCFDSLFGRPSKLQNPPEGSQANWSIDETKSTDGGPQVVAANLVGDTVLVLRCKYQTTEAAFSTQYNYLGYKSVDVQLRVNDQNPFKEVWKASINGRAAFAPDAVALIHGRRDPRQHSRRWGLPRGDPWDETRYRHLAWCSLARYYHNLILTRARPRLQREKITQRECRT